MSLPTRLTLGRLPEDLLRELQGVASNPVSQAKDATDIEIPFTGEVAGTVAAGTEDDVERAFKSARAAQKVWVSTTFAHRRKIFRRFHDLVAKHRDLLVDMVQLETGKSRDSAFDEVMDVMINARYYSNKVEKLMTPKRKPGALPVFTRSYEQHVPRGVVGQISPWNYPLALGISDAIPALLAGNGVVAKPDSSTPFTSLLVFKLLFDAGLPTDLAHIVTGSGRVVGSAIANRCDYLMFTGSTKTGKVLGRTAGERLIGYSAELGGKNPMIIAADADIDKTVRESISACFSNSGQLCVSIERMYVEAPIFEEFSQKFAERVRSMKLGNTLAWNYEMGSLASADQLETVESFVADARDKGAVVLAGGKARPDLGPYFYEPTVLTNVSDGVRLKTDEVFGPVVYIQKVSDLSEAIALANDTDYGLNASVFGQSKTAQFVGNNLMAGGVTLNDGYTASWASISIPLGGVKESGMSRRHGAEGLLKYTETRNLSEQRWLSMRGPAALPRSAYARIMTTALRLGKTLKFLP